MDKEKFISALQDNFGETFNNAKHFSGEIKDLIRSTALKTLDNLDIVSREEFEVLKKLVQKQELAIKKLTKKKKTTKVKKS